MATIQLLLSPTRFINS